VAVRKYVKFAAPYSSKTFNKVNQLLGGVNGVVTGGEVSTSGSTVTVQPMTFVQNGLFVDVDAALTATLPSYITAPYFVAVTVSSGIENLSEVITPTFVKRPQDVSENTVLVAQWDGQEWRALPKLQLEEIYLHEQLRAREMDFEGVASGFDVTQDASSLIVAKGAAVATDGSLVKKSQEATLTKVAADADGLDRVDEVVLRKPLDSSLRIGEVQYVVGPTFSYSANNVFFTETALDTGASSTSVPKVLNSPTTNDHYFVYLSGGDLVFAKSPDALSSLSSPVVFATTGITEFDACLNPDGWIDVVYMRGTALYHMRLDATGTTLILESTVYTNLNTISSPKIISIREGSTYKLHIAFIRNYSVADDRVMYLRMSSAGGVDTAAVSWVNLSDELASPSLEKDDDDSLLFLAFENTGTERIYLRTYDVSTATATSAPTQVGNSIELQDDTYDLSAGLSLPTTGALKPVVKRTAFKETYVFWRHHKGSGNYGMACYHRSYKEELGHKAVVRDLLTSGENIDDFGVALDGLNNAYLALRISGDGIKAAVKLSDYSLVGVTEYSLSTPPGLGLDVLFNSRGALVHVGASTGPNKCFFMKSSAGAVHNLRDYSLAPSDIYLAHYRTSDEALSVAGTAIEEDDTIRRLYEFNNLYASGGVATWGKVAPSTLELVAPLVIKFLNRRATYTVPSNSPTGISIPVEHVCFVRMPSEDTTQNLSLEVQPFGEIPLDRHNRNIFPLFWNIGGNLYMRFAPWRAESGETIIVGEGVSQELMDWLGTPSLQPDALNHIYGGNILLPSDSHEAALNRLDEVLKDLVDQLPEEETQTIGAGGSTTFTASTLGWFNLNSVPDMTIFWNGQKLQQALDGNSANGDFIKTSANTVQFSYTLPQYAKITARLERQYAGGGGGGFPLDLENIQVDIQPDLNGNHSVGSISKGWKSLFLKDKVTAQVYELEVVSGTLQATAVP
jgi:hypothetical protein